MRCARSERNRRPAVREAARLEHVDLAEQHPRIDDHALRHLSFKDPSLLRREMLAAWPFFRATVDNLEMVLSKSDMGIAALYSTLVEDRALADSIFGHIRETWLLTHESLLAVTGQTRLLERHPALDSSIRLRLPYIEPLESPAGRNAQAAPRRRE